MGNDRVRFAHERDIVDGVVFGYAKYSSVTKVNGVLGGDVELMGDITPLMVQAQYYINLEKIKIGDKNIKILSRNKDDYTGGLMDTRSIYTIFPLLIVEKFIDDMNYSG
ncbi:hypothetical protein C2S52_013066 [Perilla frutescens var. hirtella]|nr:hypothetical protein C2S52_013066 [Perilla frutescens var. hirtella]